VIARRPNHPSALVPPNGYDSEAAQTASLRNPRRVAKRVGVMLRGRRPSLRVYNGAAFAKLIVETKGVLKERMYKPETLVSGDLALVRGRYGFYVDDRFSHCGMNSFHLMRTADGWKIVSAASTIELDGCEPEAKERQ
jgi:hypothetical protein